MVATNIRTAREIRLLPPWTGSDGRGYLARTYYAEIEYVLPGAVMQPVWSSVKYPDGSVNFGLSYHRAFYSPDYDDYHDIYIQRYGTTVPRNMGRSLAIETPLRDSHTTRQLLYSSLLRTTGGRSGILVRLDKRAASSFSRWKAFQEWGFGGEAGHTPSPSEMIHS